MVGGMQDGRVIENIFLLQMIKNATNILIHRDQTCIVVLCDAFERPTGNMRGRSAELVFRVDKTLRFSRIPLQIVIKACRLSDRYAVVEIASRRGRKNGSCGATNQISSRKACRHGLHRSTRSHDPSSDRLDIPL